jgi:hypothetical protein
MMPRFDSSRRQFLRALPGFALLLASPMRAAALVTADHSGKHPEPRPGIDASRVLKAEDLDGDEELIELFDNVRKIPQIVDGIRCSCGCADLPRSYSLLSCYEGGGMARYCQICQNSGRIAYERHLKGDSLKEIRRQVDAGADS